MWTEAVVGWPFLMSLPLLVLTNSSFSCSSLAQVVVMTTEILRNQLYRLGEEGRRADNRLAVSWWRCRRPLHRLPLVFWLDRWQCLS